MAVAIKKTNNDANVAPHWHAHAREIQKYGSVIEDMPHPLSARVRADMVAQLNQLLADSITLRDMYKKHHWQVSGPPFYQLHGGVTIAMGIDAGETTRIRRPPRGREEVPVQISRLLEAHKLIIQSCLDIAEKASDAGDQGTNDLAVSDILRPNELQSWFIGQHLVEMPLILEK